MKDMERKFKADKVLMERDFHTSLLESTDAAFERGRQVVASLYTEATHEFDGGRACFCQIGKFSYTGSMFWNKGRQTSIPSRRKNFARISFVPARAFTRLLASHFLPICLRIHQRGKLERSKSATAMLMKKESPEGFQSFHSEPVAVFLSRS